MSGLENYIKSTKNMKKATPIIVIIIIAIVVTGYILWQKNIFPKTISGSEDPFALQETLKGDPFVYIYIPETLDDATKEIYELNINRARDSYNSNPEAWESWVAVGNMYQQQGLPNQAIAAFNIAIEKEPLNILSLRNIAEVYSQQLNDYQRAATYYQLALKQKVNDPTLYVSFSRLLDKRLNRAEEAEQTLLVGIEGTGGHPNIYIALISFYQEHGQTEKAKEYVQEIIQKFPESGYEKRWPELAR